MGRPRKETQTENVQAQPDRPLEEGAQPAATAGKAEVARTLTLRFDENGKPLPITEETRARLREALREGGLLTEELSEELAPSGLINEKFGGQVLDTVTLAQSYLAARFTGVAAEKAREILKMSAAEKEEINKALLPVLNKRLGPWLARHPDEYGLVLVLLVVEAQKWARAKEALKKRTGGDDGHQG